MVVRWTDEGQGRPQPSDVSVIRGAAYLQLFRARGSLRPHLAYREEGVQGVIPPNAVLTAELSVISERPES
jgi:hypothetical protein